MRSPVAVARSSAQSRNRLYQLGGISCVAAGCLFLAKSILDWLTGPPPATGSEILVWIAEKKLFLASTSEVLFIALAALLPAVVALYASLAKTHRASATLGCGLLALTLPILGVLLVVHGRFSYPVFHITIHTPDIAELAVATYYGGLHAVALLFALGTLVLSFAMRRTYGRPMAYLGYVTAAFDVIGGYPDAIGPNLWLVCGVFFAAWLVAVGIQLHKRSANERITS